MALVKFAETMNMKLVSRTEEEIVVENSLKKEEVY